MKDENLYICKVPLESNHIFSEPYEVWTVDETWGTWCVISKNKSKNLVILAQSLNLNIRMRMDLKSFKKHFEVVKEEVII